MTQMPEAPNRTIKNFSQCRFVCFSYSSGSLILLFLQTLLTLRSGQHFWTEIDIGVGNTQDVQKKIGLGGWIYERERVF